MTNQILYTIGRYTVRHQQFGKTLGYAVYRDGATAAERVAQIGYAGLRGLTRARAEADRRHASDRPVDTTPHYVNTETIDGDPNTAVNLSFQIRVF